MDTLLLRRRMMMAAKRGVLPPEYLEIPYLSLAGNIAVNTGLVDVDDITIKFSIPSYKQWGGVFGNYINESYNCIRIILDGTDNGNLIATIGGKASVSLVAQNAFDYGQFVTCRLYKNGNYDYFVINGNAVSKPHEGGINNSRNIYLGRSGQPPTIGVAMSVDVAEFKAFKDGVLLVNYIPCKRIADETQGFYDAVSGIFISI